MAGGCWGRSCSASQARALLGSQLRQHLTKTFFLPSLSNGCCPDIAVPGTVCCVSGRFIRKVTCPLHNGMSAALSADQAACFGMSVAPSAGKGSVR